MKWKVYLGTVVLAVGLCSPSYATGLLDRVLEITEGALVGGDCCQDSCCHRAKRCCPQKQACCPKKACCPQKQACCPKRACCHRAKRCCPQKQACCPKRCAPQPKCCPQRKACCPKKHDCCPKQDCCRRNLLSVLFGSRCCEQSCCDAGQDGGAKVEEASTLEVSEPMADPSAAVEHHSWVRPASRVIRR